MARLPKVEPAGHAEPAADENPFALPVARNLGPKPGDSLFSSSAPPAAAKPALPEAKIPKAEPLDAEPVAAEDVPSTKLEVKPVEPPRKEPPPKKKELEPPIEEEAEEEPSAALFLPSSTKEIVIEPETKRMEASSAQAAQAPSKRKPETEAPKAGDAPKANRTPVYLAATAGAALGLLSIGVLFVTLRPEPQGASARVPGSSPFGKRAAGDAGVTPGFDAPAVPPKAIESPPPIIESESPMPTALPAPVVRKPVEPPPPASPAPPPPAPEPPKAAHSRPTATFAKIPFAQPAAPAAAKPKPAAPVAAPKIPAGPQWVFEGTVYDLISTKGVFGVRLVFVDAEDNEVASIETTDGGRYKAAMKPGPETGYTLRILHDDYSGKHIDELDSTSSVRKADLEQRKFLLQAGARSLPWIGTVGKAVRRDMALVPKATEE